MQKSFAEFWKRTKSEMDYGTRLGVYQGKIDLSANEKVEADVLYLGRVSLIARNLSGETFWSWSQQQKPGSLLVLNKKQSWIKRLPWQTNAPSMLTLPVSLTVAEGK